MVNGMPSLEWWHLNLWFYDHTTVLAADNCCSISSPSISSNCLSLHVYFCQWYALKSAPILHYMYQMYKTTYVFICWIIKIGLISRRLWTKLIVLADQFQHKYTKWFVDNDILYKFHVFLSCSTIILDCAWIENTELYYTVRVKSVHSAQWYYWNVRIW